MMATTLLVVPRSIPIGFAMILTPTGSTPVPAQGGVGDSMSNRCATGYSPSALRRLQKIMSLRYWTRGLDGGYADAKTAAAGWVAARMAKTRKDIKTGCWKIFLDF